MQFMNGAPPAPARTGFAELIETWVEMARQDGSLGWIGIANIPSSCFAAAYLPDEGFEQIFAANKNRVTMGGQFFPSGTGDRVAGGYKVTGAWQFGSGTGHSEYVCAGFLPMDDGQMVMADAVMPLMMVAIVPREQVTFTDGWHVWESQGHRQLQLRTARCVRAGKSYLSLMTRTPRRGPMYQFRGHAAHKFVAAGLGAGLRPQSQSTMCEAASIKATWERLPR
ncbi:MAG: hypothetical protein R3E50_01190 [Halioglobus sp.]